MSLIRSDSDERLAEQGMLTLTDEKLERVSVFASFRLGFILLIDVHLFLIPWFSLYVNNSFLTLTQRLLPQHFRLFAKSKKQVRDVLKKRQIERHWCMIRMDILLNCPPPMRLPAHHLTLLRRRRWQRQGSAIAGASASLASGRYAQS